MSSQLLPDGTRLIDTLKMEIKEGVGPESAHWTGSEWIDASPRSLSEWGRLDRQLTMREVEVKETEAKLAAREAELEARMAELEAQAAKADPEPKAPAKPAAKAKPKPAAKKAPAKPAVKKTVRKHTALDA